MALTAAPLEAGFQQFLDNNGVPLAGGFIYTFQPNTAVPKATWQDPLQVSTNANPITLDSGGRCIMFGSGQYRLQLFTALGVLVEDNLGASADLNSIQAGLTPFTGDTGSGGTAGMVPAPPAGSAAAGDYLSANGSFGPLNVVVPAAPAINQAGFLVLPSRIMSATDVVGTVDLGSNITWNGAGVATLMIQPDASIVFPGGPTASIVAQVMINVIVGAGTVTLTRGAGVSLYWPGSSATSANRSLLANSQCVISHIGANTWTIAGAGIA